MLAAIAPGIADLKDGHRRGWVPFALLLASAGLLLTVSGRGRAVLTETVDLVALVLAAGLLSLSMLTSVVLRTPGSGRNRISRTTGCAAGLVLAALPVTTSYWLLEPQIRLLDASFVTTQNTTGGGNLIEVPDHTLDGSDLLLTEWQEKVTTATPGGRLNVLLLGGDAGPGRWSLRTDSINLVSIDTTSGDTAMIGIPRNLYGAPMPAGFEKEFPRGFNNLINAVYTWGAANPDKVEKNLGETPEPGATLISAVVSELTGQHVDAFVLVDMQGFIEMVDALGGVDVYVPKDLPAPGNVPGGKHPVTDMKKGWRQMDGTDALSFSRSRSGDSDYWRMGRQRCMLASLAAQNTKVEILANWRDLSEAIRDNVVTNLAPNRLLELIDAANGLAGNSRSLSLTPPLISSTKWELETIHQLVRETIRPVDAPTVAELPVDGDDAMSGSRTSTQSPETTDAPAQDLTEECRVRR